MDSENSLSPPILAKEAFKSSFIPSTISGFAMIPFAFFVSIGVLFQLEIPLTTSDQSSNNFLLSMAWLTFSLGSILSPLLFTMNSTTKPLDPISARLINYLATATPIASFTTLILAIPELSMDLTDLNKLSHGEVGWAIQSVLICFAVAGLYKLIREKFTSYYHKCLNVAFLNLSILFAGLYAWPIYYLPGTIPYSYISYRTDRLYHIALLPVTFVLVLVLYRS